MGILLKAIGASVAIAGIKKIRKNIDEERQRIEEENKQSRKRVEEENRRRNSVCLFDNGISRETFYAIVEQSRKGVRRVTSLYAEDAMVYGTVRSQSGMSDWCFRIDFNDFGKLTGKHWIFSDNCDSDIPKVLATRISRQIEEYNSHEFDPCQVEPSHHNTNNRPSAHGGANCPYCGKVNNNKEAKFCMYCGMRFRV